MGLCDSADFDAITRTLMQRAHLKEIYGTDWWEQQEQGSTSQ
jgi:hypothetical protein